MADEEDASNLNFGPEFKGKVECLSDLEVTTLLTQQKKESDREFGLVTQRTFDDVKRSLGGRDVDERLSETIGMRQALEDPTLVGEESKLHSFEIASLVNLMSNDSVAEEAKALIPSLRRFSDEIVDKILEVLKNHRGPQ
mmetsp:Transcript_18758/g.74878  ORF Transcript_18758/g.74878 Transcript_18758/m.74878 type:complete len:140 (+) Transcript_18758:47-466(+)|eukprot:CAMPEP_0185689538 /NCGR_PEP_ID=MMETSP1164-20130828/521_1 /TAXON_ID=1104430 /ORGANISM="Chrysoreinhardia sp, Strain CCMP2950" /LENGTH=139 /DNA_ID=CAMNT_0028356041 /DNA_START=14 /DNA_END=433 /DNA_ORIENTATION=-